MSLSRRAAKRDDVEPAIIEALEKAKASVSQLSGAGVPDLLVGYGGQTFLLEVKSPGGRLTEEQTKWIVRWRGERVPIVATAEEALQAIGIFPWVRRRSSTK